MRTTFVSRSLAIILLLCMVFVMLPISVSAANEDCISIAINDQHKSDLQKTYLTLENANQYNQEKHCVELIVGANLQLSVVGFFHTEYAVEWESTDPTVASITSNGNLFAVEEGATTIVAKSGDLTASLIVSVSKTFDLTSATANMSINKLCNLDVDIQGDLTGYVYRSEWTSTNESIAVVGKGLILASRAGTGQIIADIYEIATDKHVSIASCDITVHPDITSVLIANKRTELELGSTMKLNVQTMPEKQPVILMSSNEELATIEDGVLTAKGVGVVTVYAYAGCWHYNEYVVVPEIMSSITLNIWSDSTIQYDVGVTSGTKGKVTVDKKSALSGETVTIKTENVYESNGSEYEMFGASAVSVIDENGMAVATVNHGQGVYSFVMPKSPVTVSAIYSSMYSVTYKSALKANFARDNNLVSSITINEYVGGSFNGMILLSSPKIKLSNAVSTHGNVTVNENGTIELSIDADRTSATKITIDIYADAQEVTDGGHSIVASGDMSLTLDNAFVACNAGDINETTTVIKESDVENLENGSTLTVTSNGNIAIYGEAMLLLKAKHIGLDLTLPTGRIVIPYSSLEGFDVASGDFTIFDLAKSASTVIEDENTVGTYNLTVQTYTGTGARKNQVNMIGKASVGITTDKNGKLTLQTGLETYMSDKNGMFHFESLSGISSFVVSHKAAAFTTGDIIFTIIIILLIACACVALFFLLKKRGFIGGKPTAPTTPEEPVEETSDDDSDDFDEDAFKTVDDILREANLQEELAQMRAESITDLGDEIQRAGEELQMYDSVLERVTAISEIISSIQNMPDSLKVCVDEYSLALSTYEMSKESLQFERDAAQSTLDSLSDETGNDELRLAVEKIRGAIAICSSARELLEGSLDTVLQESTIVREAEQKLAMAKETLAENISKFEEKNDSVYKDYLQHLNDAKNNLETIAADPALAEFEKNYDLINRAYKFIDAHSDTMTSLERAKEQYIFTSDVASVESASAALCEDMEDLDALIAGDKAFDSDYADCMKQCDAYMEDMRKRAEAELKEAKDMVSGAVNEFKIALGSYLAEKANTEKQLGLVENKSGVQESFDTIVADEKAQNAKLLECFERNFGSDGSNEIEINIDAETDVKKLREFLNIVCEFTKESEALRSGMSAVGFACVEQQKLEAREKAEKSVAEAITEANSALADSEPIIADTKKVRDSATEKVSTDDLDALLLAAETNADTLQTATVNANAAAEDKEVPNETLYAHAESVKDIAHTLREVVALLPEVTAKTFVELEAYLAELDARSAAVIAAENAKIDEMFALIAQRRGHGGNTALKKNPFDDCVKRVCAEHSKTMELIRSVETMNDDHKALLDYSNAIYENACELYVSDCTSIDEKRAAAVVNVINKDLDLEDKARSILLDNKQQMNAPVFGAPRVPRRRLEQATLRMQARNRYFAILV